MKIIESKLRAVVERVTEIEVYLFGEKKRLFIFQNLDQDGIPCDYWVQNWECEDITQSLNNDTHRLIKDTLFDYYKSECNAKKYKYSL
jgi:hypothetical protein